MVKKVANIGSIGVGAIPAVLPVVKTAQSFSGGGNVETAVNAGLGLMGISTTGSVDWKKATSYAIFTGACYGGMIGLRMLAKRL